MNKTVLIVDDDPLVRLIVEKMMGALDSTLTFIPCENGKIGLESLNAHATASSECIVLLDLNMPVLDGWGFLDEMKSSHLSDLANIKLYILSSSTDTSDIERSNQYTYVRKFYHKPLYNEDIIEILKST